MIGAGLKCLMEWRDAQVSAGGGDARSGGRRAGGRHARLSDSSRAFTEAPPPATVYWQGYYIGGQGGYGSSDEDFGRFPSTAPLMRALLGGTTIEGQMGVSSWAPSPNLGKLSLRASGGGAFAGYNWQWDDVIFGVEASYLHGGFALGNADISRSVSVLDVTTPGPTNPPALSPVFLSAAEAQHNHLLYGYSAGLGVDVNLIGGLFLRAEWEYLRFTTVTDVNINTVRAGLGYKF